jgi:hypothetical protein
MKLDLLRQIAKQLLRLVQDRDQRPLAIFHVVDELVQFDKFLVSHTVTAHVNCLPPVFTF